MSADPEQLVFRNGEIFYSKDPNLRMSFKDAVRWGTFQLGQILSGRGSYAAGDEKIDFRTGHGNLAPAYNPSACVVEVEVDPDTGQVSVVGFWGADDSGTPLNPLGVKGQVLGATVMSIGHALYENLIRVEGKVLNASFRDYKMPLVTDLPRLADFQHSNVITWEPEGPFGAKEAGQGAGTGVLAALANAIHNATGVRTTRLPITPESILFGIKRARSAR